jgi:uncharacterized protein YuzB (UPF0349 family)
MTENKKQKRLARERAAKTGESYETALEQVRRHEDSDYEDSDVTCDVCGVSTTADPTRRFVEHESFTMCHLCAKGTLALADRAADGEVVPALGRQTRSEYTAAFAWALKQPEGLGHQIAYRMHSGNNSVAPEEADALVAAWKEAGQPGSS